MDLDEDVDDDTWAKHFMMEQEMTYELTNGSSSPRITEYTDKNPVRPLTNNPTPEAQEQRTLQQDTQETTAMAIQVLTIRSQEQHNPEAIPQGTDSTKTLNHGEGNRQKSPSTILKKWTGRNQIYERMRRP